ncbi:hypothetical protein K435DRAFT_696328 [Dendrothele bispora CBS 962.96]|uniref:Uncharacterized protein n=1 Tax=Dendrothele bispora (strain CBS 962.96) TaxID=1314807 RepID=A0A4S8KWE3_DENBC|nr:hypothetical protein K435DRAFT_696328 [Dendrothele bispora CBS 962.96]
MGKTTVEESSVFSVEIGLLGPIISLSVIVHLCSIGFYIFLFGLSTYFLVKHRFITRRHLHLFWTTSLFIISSFGALITVSNEVMDAVVIYNTLRTQNIDQFIEYTTQDKTQTIIIPKVYYSILKNCCIADSVLIYRCYMVWGFREWIVSLPIIASIAMNSFGLVAGVMGIKGSVNTTNEANAQLMLKGLDYTLTYYYVNAAFNLVLTLMIAGRIWWIGMKTQALMGYSQQSHVIRNKLEAGILYPIALVVHAAISGNVDKISIPINLTPTAIQLAGIAPTLIIVRTCLGKGMTEAAVSSHSTTPSLQDIDTQSTSNGPLSLRIHALNGIGQIGFNSDIQVGNDKSTHLAA